MDNLNYNQYFLVIFNLFIGYLLTTNLVPLVLRLGKKYGYIDIPNSRKNHTSKKVRIGGLAMLTTYLVLLFTNYFFNSFTLVNSAGFETILTMIFVTILFFILGLIDDIYNLSPYFRLGMQLIASSFVWYQGLRIDTISLNFISSDYSTILLPRIISLVITIIWLAGITNAINWIDGLDGLATSMSISSLLGILFLSFLFNNTILILLTSIIIGICLGFLPHNLNPSKILMGDCGSYFLGFNLASLSLLAISIYNQNSGRFDSLNSSFYVLFFIFLIPISDMSNVIFKRIREGKSPFFPDRSHLHHKLIDAHFSENNVLLILSASSILLVSIGLLSYTRNIITVMAVMIFSIIIVLVLDQSIKCRIKKIRYLKNRNEN